MTTHISDLTRSDEEILIDMINFDNDTNFKVGDFMYEHPVPISDFVRNTSMILHGTGNGKTTGQTPVTYTRLRIADLPGNERLSACVRGETRFSAVIKYVNATLGTNLTVGGYVDDALPSFEGAPRGSSTTIDLVITEDNPIYIGVLPVLIYI